MELKEGIKILIITAKSLLCNPVWNVQNVITDCLCLPMHSLTLYSSRILSFFIYLCKFFLTSYWGSYGFQQLITVCWPSPVIGLAKATEVIYNILCILRHNLDLLHFKWLWEFNFNWRHRQQYKGGCHMATTENFNEVTLEAIIMMC
jgi:hypothetical protein